jgi:hypothetical protein
MISFRKARDLDHYEFGPAVAALILALIICFQIGLVLIACFSR